MEESITNVLLELFVKSDWKNVQLGEHAGINYMTYSELQLTGIRINFKKKKDVESPKSGDGMWDVINYVENENSLSFSTDIEDESEPGS